MLEGFEYRYEIPPSWRLEGSATALEAFRQVLEGHLRPIVVELTGVVGAGLLEPISTLARDAVAAARRTTR